MNLGLRAILYTVRKWKKTLLVFFLLLAITTLVLSGLAIADAQEEQAEEVRGTTGASFTVERNLSTGGWANDSDGTYSTQELITKDMIQKIASVEGITGYDASNGGVPTLYDEEGNNLSLSPDGFAYYAYGAYNSEFNSLFVSGRFELVEGSHITEDVTDGIILSRESVEKNGLKIGDKITGIINPEYNDPEVEMELIGVFDIVADKDDTINMYDASTYWDYNQYAFCSNSVMEALAVNYSDDGIERAFFYVEDAAQLDNVIKNVQHIDSINWNNFIITLQYVLETLLIAAVAFPLAYLSSKQVAGALGTLFGKASENVIVTPEHFMLVAIVGGILLITAVLISSISAMRLKPRQILSQME